MRTHVFLLCLLALSPSCVQKMDRSAVDKHLRALDSLSKLEGAQLAPLNPPLSPEHISQLDADSAGAAHHDWRPGLHYFLGSDTVVICRTNADGSRRFVSEAADAFRGHVSRIDERLYLYFDRRASDSSRLATLEFLRRNAVEKVSLVRLLDARFIERHAPYPLKIAAYKEYVDREPVGRANRAAELLFSTMRDCPEMQNEFRRLADARVDERAALTISIMQNFNARGTCNLAATINFLYFLMLPYWQFSCTTFTVDELARKTHNDQ